MMTRNSPNAFDPKTKFSSSNSPNAFFVDFGAGKFLGIACPTMGCERECDSREIREAVDDEAFAQCSSGRCPKGDWRSTNPQDFCVFEIGGRAWLPCHDGPPLQQGKGCWGLGLLLLSSLVVCGGAHGRYTRLVEKARVDVDVNMRWCPKPGCESAIQGAEQGSTRGQGGTRLRALRLCNRQVASEGPAER